jgi:hypothetical protein
MTHEEDELMKSVPQVIAMCAAVILYASASGRAPADAPSGATGLCKDGTYYTGATKKGACHGHKGVKTWFAEAAPAGAAPAVSAASPAVAQAAAGSVAAGGSAAAQAKIAQTPAAATSTPGGGPDKVWVNTTSKVYHCQADKWYGKTKQGEYMTESDAVAKGFRAEHGKACS